MHTPAVINYTYVIILAIFLISGNASASKQHDQNPVNFDQIKQYAEYANASYLGSAKMRELGSLKNYRLSHHGNIPDIEISYFLLTNDTKQSQIIAVRGTSNIENAYVDVALKLTMDDHAGIRMHSGFSLAAQAIYTEIRPKIKTGYTINTTGHSLGGAVAVILAMYLDVDNFKIGQVITFGQPKVTNISGANKFQHLNITRVVTPKDLVPLVPPFDPVDINNLDIYWHPGKEVILFPDATYAVLEGLNSMLRATQFTQQTLDENNLINHQMTLYLAMLDKKIPNAKLIPFKNSFNLFNWFGGGEK